MRDANLILAMSKQETMSLQNYKKIDFLEYERRLRNVYSNQMNYFHSENVIKKNKNDVTISLLYKNLQEQPWYKLHRDIINNVDSFYLVRNNSLKIFTRPYVDWCEIKMKQYAEKSSVMIKEKVIDECLHMFRSGLIKLSLHNLMFDQEKIKKEESQITTLAETMEVNLTYARSRFWDEESYDSFFNDYPILARLLAEFTNLSIEKFCFFVYALEESAEEVMNVFQLSGQMILEDVIFTRVEEQRWTFSFCLNHVNFIFRLKNQADIFRPENSEWQSKKCVEKYDYIIEECENIAL